MLPIFLYESYEDYCIIKWPSTDHSHPNSLVSTNSFFFVYVCAPKVEKIQYVGSYLRVLLALRILGFSSINMEAIHAILAKCHITFFAH